MQEIKVNSKFGIGEKVFTIWNRAMEFECPICKGEGNKIIDGYKFNCTLCTGFGFLNPRKKKEYQVVGLNTITLVKTITQLQGKELVPQTVITYNVKSEEGTLREVPEHHLFTDGEEAIKYCSLLNKEVEE